MRQLLFVLLLINVLIANADPHTDASNIYDRLKGKFNSAEAIANNLQKPLTTGDTMTTLDGSNSFNAQYSCQAESEYLRVETSTGLFNVIDASITMDRDVNGSMEFNHHLSSMTSVCRNGYVRCAAPGMDFDDCQHVELSYDGNTFVHTNLAAQADKARLYGCECFTADCGSDLANPQALSALSANIATQLSTLVANHNPRFIASKVNTTGPVTTYYAQDVTTCGAADTTGASTIQDFAGAQRNDDGNYILSAGITAVNNAPSDSPLNIVMNQQNNGLLPGYDMQSCNINRVMSYRTQSGLIDEERTHFNFFSQGGNYVRCNYNLATGVATCTTDCNVQQHEFGQPIDINAMCNADSTVSIESESWWTTAPGVWGNLDTSVSVIHHQIPSCSNGLQGDVEIRDHQWDSSVVEQWYLGRTLRFLITKPTCIFQESINDMCAAIDTTNCELFNESIDGVTTLSNSFPTGLFPLPSAVSVTNGNCASFETRDWHTKDLTYKCDTPSTSFNPDVSHLQEPTITGDTAEISLPSGSYTLTRPSVPQPACQQTCEVQTTVIDTQTNIDGQASDGRLDETRLSKVFKACDNSVCPLEAGESVIQPCGCSNNFGKAATAMQMLRLAGKDFICTSGTSSEY